MAFIARGCGRDLYTARARSASAVYGIETTAINAMQHERIRTINWLIVHLNLN